MRAASWDCHRSVLRNDTHAGRTLDPTARSEPIRCGKEYIAFRCRLKAAAPCGKKLWPRAKGRSQAASAPGNQAERLPSRPHASRGGHNRSFARTAQLHAVAEGPVAARQAAVSYA